MIDAFRLASSQPWAIEPDALRTVLQVAARTGDPVALSTRLGRPLDNARNVEVRGDVALIPIRGPIFRHAGLFTEVSGATATGTLARDFQTALDNPAVRTIVFDIDSPGGEVTGIHELANQILAARGRKAIKAYIGGIGASAAYWIASAASEVIVAETAMVGSIGVVSSYVDTRERDAKNGIRQIDIVSSASPDKRLDPTSDAGRAALQRVVDSLGDVFVNSVARNRGVSAKKVIADFGRGFVMTGAYAVKAGMVDGLGSLEGVIAGKAARQPAIAPHRTATAALEPGIVRSVASAPATAVLPTTAAVTSERVAAPRVPSARGIYAGRAAEMAGNRAPALSDPARGKAHPQASALRDVFRRREEQRQHALASHRPGAAPAGGDVYARRKAQAERYRTA
jgi:signal peptide peptidase SppA